MGILGCHHKRKFFDGDWVKSILIHFKLVRLCNQIKNFLTKFHFTCYKIAKLAYQWMQEKFEREFSTCKCFAFSFHSLKIIPPCSWNVQKWRAAEATLYLIFPRGIQQSRWKWTSIKAIKLIYLVWVRPHYSSRMLNLP